MTLAGLTVLLLSGCPAETPRFAPGIARIGDSLHLFAPACPGEKMVSIKIHSSPPSWGMSLDPYTWWEASRPRSAEGPGEFVVLGDDGPFTDVIVRAGSNPTTPALPAKFDFSANFTGLTGRADDASGTFTTAGVPVHPAGTDPRLASYLTETDGIARTPEQMRAASDCRLNLDPIPASSAPAPGQQPAASFRPGAAERVARAIVGPDAIAGLPTDSHFLEDGEDVASDVCGNGPESGALATAFGRERTWLGEDLRVWQFAGAYGAIPATGAIAQVDSVLDCSDHDDGLREYHRAQRHHLAQLPGLDRQYMFCAGYGRTGSTECTVLLARGDVLSRIVVQARNRDEAVRVASELAVPAAAALG